MCINSLLRMTSSFVSIVFIFISCFDEAKTVVKAPSPQKSVQLVNEKGSSSKVHKRILSLAPSHTEWIFEWGVDQLLVGRSEHCNKPSQVKLVPSVGSLFPFQLERILAVNPSDVLMINGHLELQEKLKNFGINVHVLQSKSLDDIYQNTLQLGQILDVEDKALAWVNLAKKRINSLKKLTNHPRVLVEIWFSPLTIAGDQSYIGSLIEAVGGRLLPTGKEEWPTVPIESVVKYDPEIMFVSSKSFYEALTEKDPDLPWKTLTAVRKGQVFLLEDRLVRPNPSIIDDLLWIRSKLEAISR